MLDTEEEIVEFLNTQVSYWDGLKSSEFWREFKEKGELTSSSIYLLLALASLLASVIKSEIDTALRATLVLLSTSLLTSVTISFKNQLRLFQLSRQLKIVKAAQSEDAKLGGEVN